MNIINWLLFLGLLLVPTTASAFNCDHVNDAYGNPTGSSLAWPQLDPNNPNVINITYQLNQAGTQQLTTAQITNALSAAANTWSQVLVRATETGCPNIDHNTGINLIAGNPTDQNFVGYNILDPNSNENIVVFRDNNWRYDNYLAVLTTLTYNNLTGEIFDADIEFNTQNIQFSVDDNNSGADLQALAVYAFGRLLGFTTATDSNASLALDYSTPQSVLKRQLSCDDANAILFRYPASGSNPNYCYPSTQECGFCDYPGGLQFVPSTTIIRDDDGRGGCQSASFEKLMFMPLGYSFWRWCAAIRQRAYNRGHRENRGRARKWFF